MTQRSTNRTTDRSTDDVIVDNVLKDAIRECVRYIVCREGSKIPIKRAELNRFITTNHQVPANSFNIILSESNKVLKRVYGYKLVQVNAKSGTQYIVVLTSECDSLRPSCIDLNQRKMLNAALTHIFMSGGPVKEEDMFTFLEEAGLMEENNHNARKQFTTTFTRQMYLVHNKGGEGELARNVFDWGQRATEEVPKMFLLKKVAEALDKPVDHWCEQYKEALEESEVEAS